MSEIAFGRTRNRSLLGTLNDFAFMAQVGSARRPEPETPEELMRFLAQTPILPLDGASPIALTRAVFRASIARDAPFSVAPALDCSGALGRVKTALRRCAVLTRPARSQRAGNYRSDAVTEHIGQESSTVTRLSGRPTSGVFARLVAESGSDLEAARRLGLPATQRPDRRLVYGVEGRHERPRGAHARFDQDHQPARRVSRPNSAWSCCSSFRDFHASASATTAEAPKARDAIKARTHDVGVVVNGPRINRGM